MFHHLLVGLVDVQPGLLLQRGALARPVLPVAEEPVDDRRRVPWRRLTREVRGERSRIAPAVIRPVAADAGDRLRHRPALVPIEFLAERDLLRADGVVVRDFRGVLLETGRQLELEVHRPRPAGDQEQDDDEEKCGHSDQRARPDHGLTGTRNVNVDPVPGPVAACEKLLCWHRGHFPPSLVPWLFDGQGWSRTLRIQTRQVAAKTARAARRGRPLDTGNRRRQSRGTFRRPIPRHRSRA